MTAGTDGKTIDGMGLARINALIEKMRDFSYYTGHRDHADRSGAESAGRRAAGRAGSETEIGGKP